MAESKPKPEPSFDAQAGRKALAADTKTLYERKIRALKDELDERLAREPFAERRHRLWHQAEVAKTRQAYKVLTGRIGYISQSQ